MSTFVNVTKNDVLKEMSQWQVDGEISGETDIAPDGCFYEESAAEIKTALIRGGFSTDITSSTPIALSYIASIHRKLTALLYIQSRRINITLDGEDATRGIWGSIRRKLASIEQGESFGELTKSNGVQVSYFYNSGPSYNTLNINRSL